MWRSLFLLCCVAVATAIEATGQEPSNLTPATVRIHHERSTDSELQATVEAYGKTHHLTLKKISMPEVTIQELDFENGTINIVDVPVEQEDATFFEDQNTGAFFYMNDRNTLEGMLTDSVVLKYDNGKHVAAEINDKTSKPFCSSEQLEKLPQEEEDKPDAETRGISFSVEVTAIVDSSYLKSYRNRRGIIRYLRVYYNMVGRRFRTVSGASIMLRLTGVIVSQSPNMDALFLTGRGSLVDSSKSLSLTSRTMAKYRNSLKKFDIAHLMTQRDLYSVANGKISKGNTGIGYVGSPCYRSATRTYGTGITEDNAFYQGMLTTAHELAHNLGSPHDPKNSPSNCLWSLGYMMSYVRDSYKTFYFSPCSSRSIRATYYKRNGSCLKSTSNPKSVASLNPNLPGTAMSLTKQCRRFTGRSDAYPNPRWNGSKQCYRLSCQYPNGRWGGYRWQTSGYPALEGTRCSRSGRCLHGACRRATE